MGLQVIVGLGKTGLSFVRFCLRSNLPFAVIDSRINPPEKAAFHKLAPDAKYTFGSFDPELVLKAKRLMISPGVSLKEPVIVEALRCGIPSVGDLELFAQLTRAPIVAITGANAKSTVTTLVGEMAKTSGLRTVVAGNIGIPMLDTLEKSAELYVLEISSFQLELTNSLRGHAATVLNISEDHMDRYASLDEYVKAKQKIYSGASIAISNRTDPLTKPKVMIDHTFTFGLDKPESEDDYGIIAENGEKYLARGQCRIMPVAKLQLKGMHNVENALSALALAESVGIDRESCVKALQAFIGLPHRCQLVRKLSDVSWYNDSKGTNVGATLAAIRGLCDDGSIILIAGGVGKGADFTPLREAVKRYVRQVILLGEAAKELFAALDGASTITMVSSFAEAINYAHSIAKKDDQVLLSPACASFDMFRNYENRGEEFVRLVNELV